MKTDHQDANDQKEQDKGYGTKPVFEIEAAVPHDAAVLSSLVRRVWPITFVGAVSTSDMEHHLRTNFSISTITNEIEMIETHTFVARPVRRPPGHPSAISNGLDQVLGYVQCQAAPVSLNYSDSSLPMLQLRRVFVDVPYQNMGIGRALLNQSEKAASSHGYLALTVLVWDGNLRAQHFYIEYGFEKVRAIDIDVGASGNMLHWQLTKLI